MQVPENYDPPGTVVALANHIPSPQLQQIMRISLLLLCLWAASISAAPAAPRKYTFGVAPPRNDPTGALGIAAGKKLQASYSRPKFGTAVGAPPSKFDLSNVGGINYREFLALSASQPRRNAGTLVTASPQISVC